MSTAGSAAPSGARPARHRLLLRGFVTVGAALVTTLAVGAGSLAGAGVELPSTSSSTRAGPGSDLPPAELESLAPIFDPALERLGLRTTRAALMSADGYRPSASGTHLAIYVEPTTQQPVDDDFYVDNIVDLARVYLPTVFRRWSDLESFDICQEAQLGASGRTPPPVTQLQVTRKASGDVRWKRADLGRLLGLAAARTPEDQADSGESGDRESFFLYVAPTLRDDPTYLRARRTAGLPRVTTTSSPASGTADR